MTERVTTVIRSTVPPLRRVRAGLAELVAYRALLWFMTINRLRVRYRQSWLGWTWAVLQPLAFMAVFTIAGSAIGARPTAGVAYPLFILASLPPWAFFATSLSTSMAGVLANSSLISKVYFPREILPLSYVFAAVADLVIATALIIAALACAGHSIPLTVFGLLPVCVILTLYVVALSLLLSITQIGFRDIAIGLPLLLQVLMFTTPVLYPMSAVPGHWRALYELNPLALLVEAFRGALLGLHSVSAEQLVYAAAVGSVLLGLAYLVFKTLETDIVDKI